MNRHPLPLLRHLLRIAAALVTGVALSAQAAPSRPNIVLIVADDWGFTDLGSFGGEIPTPHLDRLATRGVRFTQFHAAASCSPSRAMLLTGVEHHRAGIGNLVESMPREHRGKTGYLGSLAPNVVTIASLLREAGYRTLAAGKWNIGTEPYNLPNERGFERSIVQGDTGSDNWVPSQRYLPHTPSVLWFEDGRPATMPAEFYSSAWFADRMIDYLQPVPGDDRPFFALLAFQANHVPLQAPRKFVDRHAGRYEDGWDALRRARRDRAAALGIVPAGTPLASVPTVTDWTSLSPSERRYQARVMQVYAAMTEAMDHEVGRVVAHLEATGRLDDTVFVFMSDNGPEGSDYADARLWLMTQYSRDFDRLGGRGAYAIPGPGWASATASPLSGYKFFAGEGGIRVPMFVSGVPGSAAGGLHHGLTDVTDIAPTVLALAGVTHPGTRWQGKAVEPLAGRSLLPVLNDPEGRVRGPDDVIGYELSGGAALLQGDLKLVRNLPPFGDGGWRLYDLRTDPGETLDLAASRPETVAAMRTRWEAWAEAHHVLPMPAGYSVTRQVMFNSIERYWLPTYGAQAAIVTAGVLGLAVLGWRRRRTRRSRGAA
jgi:arylsulfatase A-like enzyme